MPNALMVIHPYRDNGAWVFDDPEADLVKEPFVSGMDDMIDRMVADLPDAELGFHLYFSAAPFSGLSARADLAAQGIRRQLVPQRHPRHGRLALSGLVQVFRQGTETDFRPSQSAVIPTEISASRNPRPVAPYAK
ncbi:hypothetical protein [Thiorhodovibrio winogradskyi]|uniref:hypothetical protein n=1 Tax=Thiorhodovibrio winogradskyi TaxID=77007 RepID=UPI001F5E20FF|nr:hypothetical protein [Thiorhodovibrio winogradskyi]WPL12268.1 hypothetical protein Thiosp_02032 [Thiorhodovibrio litoralis]